MEKQDLKSLLENIYEAMILPTLGDQALSNPSLLNPPWQSPLSPTGPITPTEPETPMWTPELEQWLRDRIRESTPGGWLGIRGFPPAGVPPLPDGFPSGTQEWYQRLTPEQRQLLLDWVNQHFGMLDLFNHREFFEDVLRGKHSQQELLKWLKENWPELYRP